MATVISLALLFLGLLIKPWTLVLVLVVAFGGPLGGRLESLAASPVSKWRRSHWVGLALLLAAVLLALTGSSGGQGALILALLPVAWVLVTDRSILQGSQEDEPASLQEPLTLSRAADEAESSAQVEAKLDREAAAAEPPERLVGGELLAKIKELGDVGKSDLVRACGYFSQRPDGSERLNFTDFYEALLEAKGIETSSSNSDNEDEEEPAINYDDLWAYFQEGGGDIWNAEETVYLGTFEGDPGTYIVEVNGPDEYEVPYCTGRDDLPRIVGAFVENGGAISDLLKAASPSLNNAGNKDLPEGWSDLGDSEIVERLKTSLDISAETLRSLSSSDDWEVRQAVAWHENTPADVIEALAEDDDSDVRRATQERSLPKEWRTMSEEDKVRALQAADIPIAILEALATSRTWTVRQAVALSPSTPESILATLKKDNYGEVSGAASAERQLPLDWRFLTSGSKAERLGNESVDLAVLQILTQSVDPYVRRAVAMHSATPEQLLRILREDVKEIVRSGVRERDLPESWRLLDESGKVSALQADDVPENVLGILGQSDSYMISNLVARNQLTPTEILRELSDDEDSDISLAAKRTLLQQSLPEEWRSLESLEIVEQLRLSTRVSAEILRALSGSLDWPVRQAVAWHDNTPADVVEALAKDDDSDVSQATLERCIPQTWRFMSQEEKVEALKSDDLSLEIIEYFARSEIGRLRQAVALSPSTPESVLEKLIEDNEYDVKEAVLLGRQLPFDWRFLRGREKAERLAKESVDLAVLEILVQSQDSGVRRAVALHPATTERLISNLREDQDEGVQSGIRERELPDSWKSLEEDERISSLKRDDVPESVLGILARSHSWLIRQAVALSPGANQAILDGLSNDEYIEVRSALRERNLPDEWKLLDEDEKVEKLEEGIVDLNILEILSESWSWRIRQTVAQNTGTSEKILKSLLQDDDDDVKRAAKKSLKRLTGENSDTKASGPLTYHFAIFQGDSNSGSCYLAELQTIEQDGHQLHDGEITDELREALEEGCIGWGPYKDQNLIVWTEDDGEEEIIAVIDIEDAINGDNVHDLQFHLPDEAAGKHLIGVMTDKGSFCGEIELDIESFEEGKVTFGVINLADRWVIVTSVQYDGNEVEMEGDSTGKSSGYYIFEDGDVSYID